MTKTEITQEAFFEEGKNDNHSGEHNLVKQGIKRYDSVEINEVVDELVDHNQTEVTDDEHKFYDKYEDKVKE